MEDTVQNVLVLGSYKRRKRSSRKKQIFSSTLDTSGLGIRLYLTNTKRRKEILNFGVTEEDQECLYLNRDWRVTVGLVERNVSL